MRKRTIRGTRKKTCSKCNAELEEHRKNRYRYCNACHAEHMRLNRKKYHELSPDQKKKASARARLNEYLRRGNVIKGPCEKCGSDKSEAHHADYSQPLVVTWLCRSCHLFLHKNQSNGSHME